MGFAVMLWGAKKLVPAEYWCPYGTMRWVWNQPSFHVCLDRRVENNMQMTKISSTESPIYPFLYWQYQQ